MRIISKKTLVDYWKQNPAAKAELEAWYAEAEEADWTKPVDVKAKYGNASILKEGRVVFNICGNNYRLVARINYDYRIIYVRFVGSHKEYDKIDVRTV